MARVSQEPIFRICIVITGIFSSEGWIDVNILDCMDFQNIEEMLLIQKLNFIDFFLYYQIMFNF